MLRLEKILGFRLMAKDGRVGRVSDCFIDDRRWVVRWLVIESGSWLRPCRTLVRPVAVEKVHREKRELEVHLTRLDILTSPRTDADPPVSDQWDHQSWSSLWSLDATSEPERIFQVARERSSIRHDPHLRSFREIRTYITTQGEKRVASVEDFIIDTFDWSVQYMVAGLGRWRVQRRVAVPTIAIAKISWFERILALKHSTGDLRSFPLLR